MISVITDHKSEKEKTVFIGNWLRGTDGGQELSHVTPGYKQCIQK